MNWQGISMLLALIEPTFSATDGRDPIPPVNHGVFFQSVVVWKRKEGSDEQNTLPDKRDLS
jgi:hypothetical protein